MGRSPIFEKGVKKGPWTSEEDRKLVTYIEEHGHGSWRALPVKAGLQRCGKSCRLRWTNYLIPDIKRGKFSLQEEQTIIQLHALLGNSISPNKQSHLSGLETPKDQTMPIVNIIKNVEPSSLEDMTTEDRMNNWKISNGSFNAIESPKGKVITPNTLEVNEMIYQDDYLKEALTNHLVKDANNEKCHLDFEDDISYWSTILDKLGNNSSLSYVF
ncbi:hypothetical protein L2E82_13638 [Cichorium intybus]|uniref:Uncharacterized protein n=1 Tax=Cichorium intybus TaxID=13427 RepID=A0ACB9EX86_CICIN|nr:hypothetical protein L2E82_13638 [Cichorium intybus]